MNILRGISHISLFPPQSNNTNERLMTIRQAYSQQARNRRMMGYFSATYSYLNTAYVKYQEQTEAK